MKIHREGYTIIITTILLITPILVLINIFLSPLFYFFLIAGIGLLLFVLQFFRHPRREIAQRDDSLIYSPADGTIVVVEERTEDEFIKEKRLMVSIFMSITDVHCNRVPVSGVVTYVQHHPGRYLVAWRPKSSSENERTTTAIRTSHYTLLLRQIAGAMARRISTYPKVGERVGQGQELGFIKFGSRVDLFLPLDAEVKVKLNQKVKANVDVIAEV